MGEFDVDAFLDDCRACTTEDEPLAALREVVARAVADPEALERSLGHVVGAGYGLLLREAGLTVQHAVFAPGYETGVHDHRMPAVIGTWGGYEDNAFYRRRPDGHLAPAGGKRCRAGEVLVLDDAAIHEVAAPSTTWTAGLHVYLGDLRATERSCWPDPAAPPEPYDGLRVVSGYRAALERSGLWAC